MFSKTSEYFPVVHIDYITERPFEDIVATLEGITGDVGNGIYEREIASASDKDDFTARVHGFESETGFMRFLSLSHGDFLGMFGQSAKVRQYTLGNPLLARTMLQHGIGAALNVPVRLVIYEDAEGRTHVGYDKPSSLMGWVPNDKLEAAAQKLDEKLRQLVERTVADL